MTKSPLFMLFAVVLFASLLFSCTNNDSGNETETLPSSSSKPSSSSGTSSQSVGVSSNSGGTNKCNSIANCQKKQIGSQYWLAENLNYDVSGSVCYDNDPANCDKYGRLYDWATAMALPSKCNTTLSTSDSDCAIKTPNHQGVCPSGWHIPSNAEWDRLYRYADGTSGTSSPYYSETAGRYLKATDGWYK